MNILFVMGTRPEAIKLAPLILHAREAGVAVSVCLTSQHKEMLQQVLGFFCITPDFDLALMREDQSLNELASRVMLRLDSVLSKCAPDYVVVQGDTTTALCAALASYYRSIPVIHVEAGLRSGDLGAPFPEEGNRAMISRIARVHFAPTEAAARNLANEGIVENVHIGGNSVVDALLLGQEIIAAGNDDVYRTKFAQIDFEKKIILVTTHRRENFGAPLLDICRAIKALATMHADVEVVLPVHPNPCVKKVVTQELGQYARIHLIEPLGYSEFLWVLSKSCIVLTDSGGVQEEAPSFSKPVLVLREVTERMEGVDAGVARLVGTNAAAIIEEASKLLTDADEYRNIAKIDNPYGDGQSRARFVEMLKNL